MKGGKKYWYVVHVLISWRALFSYVPQFSGKDCSPSAYLTGIITFYENSNIYIYIYIGEYSLFQIFSIPYAWSVTFCERKNRNLVIRVCFVSGVGSSFESSLSSVAGILRLLLKLFRQKEISYKSLDPTLASENGKMLTSKMLRSLWIIMLWTDSRNEVVQSVIPIVETLLERVERYNPSGIHIYSAEHFAIL